MHPHLPSSIPTRPVISKQKTGVPRERRTPAVAASNVNPQGRCYLTTVMRCVTFTPSPVMRTK